MVPDIKQLIHRMRFEDVSTPEFTLADRISEHGLGPEIVRIFQAEMKRSQSRVPTALSPLAKAFINMLEYIGTSCCVTKDPKFFIEFLCCCCKQNNLQKETNSMQYNLSLSLCDSGEHESDNI